jgi:ATP-binding cassette subfamily D (ALD) protein 3
MKVEIKEIYKCDFCNKLYQVKRFAEYHEKGCSKNPENERPCFNCHNMEKRETEITGNYYNGSEWEKTHINNKFYELHTHVREVLYRRFLMGIYDSMLVKYGAVMVGYTVIGLPVFGPGKEKYLREVGNDPSKITKDYVRNSSLLINLAKAIGRIVVSYKDV